MAVNAGSGDASEDVNAPPDMPTSARRGALSYALYRVARGHRALTGDLLRKAGLYLGQEILMMYLWDRGACGQSELAAALEVDASTLTRMVQRLAGNGLVTRRPDPADRRAVVVEATEAGHALRDAVEQAWTELEERTVGTLSPSDRRELARLLALVDSSINQVEEPA